ncbi:endolytic transglycosylase MltG [Sneathiella sp. CAU 1612]|uniref:Endolytic murein transglycosylase n=1 Tax=Sneathiella sedimenti TaxID=2816034 RepID=A0ABS3F7L1_9PROT|nr:endolytic transglycosylase MltG [Sneathiella sedimenti]MBO0334515.1 endolytic transglycosylase MltG [Sneathiella sedimenti]
MRPVLYTLIALIVGAGLALAGILGYGWHLFNAEGPLDTETVYVLEKGTGLRALAVDLEKNQIINNDLAFVLGVRLEDKAARLQAGEYQIPAAISGIDLMALFVSGKVIERRLTIPEGLQSREIKALIEAAPGLEGEITRNMPEGAFLPETYQYRLGDSRDELIDRMATAMQGAIDSVIASTPLPPELKSEADLVILASIVEKETALAEERPRVAGVFLNRLRKGMMLQSDPTVVYGITEGMRDLGRPLSKKDLATPTDYNTYQMMGLPKGPIANPGLESLSAVLQPEETKFLYFVADGTGGHAFSTTLAGHNDNVRKWRKLNKKK